MALGDPSVSRHAVRINAKDHLPRIDSFQTKNEKREMQYSSFVQIEPGMSCKEAFKKLPLLKRFAITSYNDFEQFLLYAASVLKECTCMPTVRDLCPPVVLPHEAGVNLSPLRESRAGYDRRIYRGMASRKESL